MLWQEAAPQETNLETFSVHLVLMKTKGVNTKSLVLISERLITEYLQKAGTEVLNLNFKRVWVSPACCKQIFMELFELKLRENLCGDYIIDVLTLLAILKSSIQSGMVKYHKLIL